MSLRETITDAEVKEWRDHLVQRAADVFSTGAALSFSGGCDSALALFAAKEAGYTPKCYSLRFRNDWLAENIARTLNCEIDIIDIAFDDTLLERAVRELDWTRSTNVLPFVALNASVLFTLYPRIVEKNVVTGMMADHLYQTRWDSRAIYEAEGEEGLRARRFSRMDDPDLTGYHIKAHAQKAYGITVHEFYDDPWQEAWFQQFTQSAINGHQTVKEVAFRAFRDYWQRGAWWQAGASYAARNRDINQDEALLARCAAEAATHGKPFAVDPPARNGRGLVVRS